MTSADLHDAPRFPIVGRPAPTRRLVYAIVAAALIAAAAPAAAAGSEPARGTHSEAVADLDFCGTGVAVHGFFESTFTASERNGVFKTQHHGSVTLTYGSASVVVRFAGQFTDTLVGGGDGVETHLLVSKGVTEKIKLANGRVVSVDAGLIAELVTVEEGNVIDVELVTMRGPHPEAASGGALFCDLVPAALGIA